MNSGIIWLVTKKGIKRVLYNEALIFFDLIKQYATCYFL